MSDKSRHTPGPWVINEYPGSIPARTISGQEFDEIASIRGRFDWPEQAANARLIAAAPDLLEAAVHALDQCLGEGWKESDVEWHPDSFFTKFMRAVKKATGE